MLQHDLVDRTLQDRVGNDWRLSLRPDHPDYVPSRAPQIV